MTHVTRLTAQPLRLALALGCLAALTACNNPDNDGVRNGPQLVHPSPSPLAQAGSVTVTN
ncbi:MAG: hypothetical protein AAF744_14965 [Pseudomonadota bacterium]